MASSPFVLPEKGITITLPETNSSHLNIGHPNRKQSYSNHPFFQGRIVSFREGKHIQPFSRTTFTTLSTTTWSLVSKSLQPKAQRSRTLDWKDHFGIVGHKNGKDVHVCTYIYIYIYVYTHILCIQRRFNKKLGEIKKKHNLGLKIFCFARFYSDWTHWMWNLARQLVTSLVIRLLCLPTESLSINQTFLVWLQN